MQRRTTPFVNSSVVRGQQNRPNVDYWDYIGWRDPFAHPGFTARQRNYAHALRSPYVYTPQVVIDGVRHTTGSRTDAVESLIAEQTVRPKVPVRVFRDAQGRLMASIAAADFAGTADIWFVTFRRRASTKVTRGENSGRLLVNYNIVRGLTRVGQWNGAPVEIELPVGETEGDSCAVLVQTAGQGAIIGAATEPLDR